MTRWTLLRRSLRFHARAHLGVVLGAAIGSAALIGALVVGDSVRASLAERASTRLGKIHFAVSTPGRPFQADFRQRLWFLTTLYYSARWNNLYVPSSASYIYPSSANPLSLALLLPGVAAKQDGSARANHVNIIGAETPDWPPMAGWGELFPSLRWVNLPVFPPIGVKLMPPPDEERFRQWKAGETALINQTLAQQLGVRPGDEIIVRVRRPDILGMDAAISPREQDAIALRLKVGAILTEEMLGDFSLTVQQAPPANLFLPMDYLAQKTGLQGQANLMVTGPVEAKRRVTRWDGQRSRLADWLRRRAPSRIVTFGPGQRFPQIVQDSLPARLARSLDPSFPLPVPDAQAESWLEAQLRCTWLPQDAGLSVHAIEQPQAATGGEYIRPSIEITSSRIFLEAPVIAAALKPRTELLAYRQGFEPDTTNDLAFSQFVTNGFGVLTYLANLIRAGDRATPYSMVTAAGGPFVPADMRDDEILINEWLAADLNAKPGDAIELSYYVVDSGAQLVERTNSFRVRAVVPLKGIYADRTLMPEFPGLAKAESTGDWNLGFPLAYKIREQDEDYWKRYRGTPKAFITLRAGQAMWASRFGSLTAIRYETPTNSFVSPYHTAVYRNLLANLNPADLGLRFEPVRAQALRAANQSQDFGQLFLGFSLFLVVAALLLMALLFQFGLEQRATEIGTLLALGFTAAQVRRLLLLEGAALALAGGILGALGGLGYAKAMLWGLATVWRSAVGASTLRFHATTATLVLGACASTLVATLTIWLALRRQARQPICELLGGGDRRQEPRARSQESEARRQEYGHAAKATSNVFGTAEHPLSSSGGEGRGEEAVSETTSGYRQNPVCSRTGPKRASGLGASSPQPSPPEEEREKPPAIRGSVKLHGSRSWRTGARSYGIWIALMSGLVAVVIVGWALVSGETANAGAFFGAGTLLLVAGLAMAAAGLNALERKVHSTQFTLAGLGVRGCARRRKRSLATIALLACGCFMIVAISVFRLDANQNATRRSSGTGGFALQGESTLPVAHDLNSRSGREFFGLGAAELTGVQVVPFRVREGDDASCLNLNRAQKPRLLGVNPDLIAGRFTFAKVARGNRGQGWQILRSSPQSALVGRAVFSPPPRRGEDTAPYHDSPQSATDEIPAIGDANSLEWALGKKVGDTLDYIDERGRTFKLRLVGAVANSILQGSLIIDEAEFIKKFPNESGYRMFLIDAPSNSVAQVSAALTRALQDAGLELTPTVRRLDALNAVQNTYLGTFQVLGGLGLLLGSAGLGVVVLRNVLERRGELGLLLAVGFSRRALNSLVLCEHAALLAAGLGLGLAAAAVAVLPALLSRATELPSASLALTLGAVVLNGLLWTWIATRFALRGNLLAALRNE